jgi:hypothetical protein
MGNRGLFMKNRALAIDDEVYVLAKEYVKKHHVSFSALMRKSLQKIIGRSSENWLDNMLDKMDKDDVSSQGTI